MADMNDPLSEAANEKAKRRLCGFTDDDFQGCAAMERAIANTPANANRKGLVPIFTTSFGDWKTTFRGLAYKVSGSDCGVFLNACPWCREPILPKEVEDMAEVAGG